MARRNEAGVIFPSITSALTSMDPESFAKCVERVLSRFLSAASREEAESLYREEVRPLEYERVRRDAEKRREPLLDLLFITVGDQEDSPSLAAVATPARYVVFLHTEGSMNSANKAVSTLNLDATEACLRMVDGKDSLQMYGIMFEIWKDRGCPPRVGIDITGGLKTMSASGAVAAFAIPGAKVCYIDADQPKVPLDGGKAFWIRERRILMGNPFDVFGEIRRRSARELMRKGKYAPAAEIYGELARSVKDSAPDDIRAALASGYDAIERMDFGRAAEILGNLAERLDCLAPQIPRDHLVENRERIRENLEGVKTLDAVVTACNGDDLSEDLDALRCDGFFDMVAMLLSSAERRFREGAYDVAALLAYRALEAIPQRRLAVRGFNPADVAWGRLASECGFSSVSELVEQYNRKTPQTGYHLPLTDLPKSVARTTAYNLIRILFPGDIADLFDIQRFAGVGEGRNRSILAHGFKKLECHKVEKILKMGRDLFQKALELEQKQDQSEVLLRRHRFIDEG